MNAYRRDFDETKYMSFLIKDNDLLKIYNEISEKVKNSIKREFDSKPVYNEKYLKTKIKSYNGKFNTNFHNNKVPREGSQFICLSVVLIDSVFITGKNYYPWMFLEECKYALKKKRFLSILLMIEITSDSDRENYDKENSDKETSDEGNSDKETSDEKYSDKENWKIFKKNFFLYIKMTYNFHKKKQRKAQK